MEKILVLDFGGQYNQLIARRVRENHVYCEVHGYNNFDLNAIKNFEPRGIILTGGPQSVNSDDFNVDPKLFELDVPILGICFGAQLMAKTLGGKVETAPTSEFGRTDLNRVGASRLLNGMSDHTTVWMSHNDRIVELPHEFALTASTGNCPIAAMENDARKLYAVQFHPEVVHTVEGKRVFDNFIDVCGCRRDWQMKSFAETKIAELKETIKGRVLCALSGGVDSSVAAALLSKAIGKNLTCVFVDHGLLRKNEADEVEAVFKNFDLNFVRVDASQRFLARLSGVTEPERKRKIIGEEFIRVFEEEAKKIGAVDYLVQGTIYPDVIESGLGKAAVIKSHHNVGGLPDHVDFKEIVEPLRLLFKDEVRAVGRELGLDEKIVSRQPFPGPGLGIRIIGEVTADKIKIVQDADAIFRAELERAGVVSNQYFAALTNMRSVGVMGDGRTYDYAVVLRAVETTDFMTATASKIPWEVLSRAADRIVNEVAGVNRVLYDCTSKPPSTIELE